jgi:hypothetical protein
LKPGRPDEFNAGLCRMVTTPEEVIMPGIPVFEQYM